MIYVSRYKYDTLIFSLPYILQKNHTRTQICLLLSPRHTVGTLRDGAVILYVDR